jgi:hypothetical protein
MAVYRPLRAGLVVYEWIRLLFLLGAFAALRPDEGAAAFPWLACLAANALFPLMALFLLLDISRYGGYGPLYAAGKFVSFFSVTGWCVFFRRHIIDAVFLEETVLFMMPGILGILLLGDLLSAAAGLVIVKKMYPVQSPAAPAGSE